MPSPKKKRATPHKTAAQKQEEKHLEKQERDKLICYRYARLRNASSVAQEYGVSRMYVTRAWDRISGDERETLLCVREQVDEDLNRKIIKAEAIAGDEFTANVVQARSLLGKELIRRCTGTDIRVISDKDFTALLRLASAIVTPSNNPDNSSSPEESIFKTLRQAIHLSINQTDE